MAQDRISVDKTRVEDIRALTKNKDYLPFDTNKDAFLYALSQGIDIYPGGILEGGKEGLFLDKDLNAADLAFLYAVVGTELEDIEDITDKDKVYSIAEAIADKGYSIMFEESEKYSGETLILKMADRANSLYKEEQEAGLFDLD